MLSCSRTIFNRSTTCAVNNNYRLRKASLSFVTIRPFASLVYSAATEIVNVYNIINHFEVILTVTCHASISDYS